jgi:rubredoxin
MQKPHVSDLPIFGDYGNSLQCPSCGNGMLHHREVLINDRFEDSKTGKSIWVGGISDWCNGTFQFKYCEESNMSLNPSPRRGGILIQFDCECCLAEPQLGIFQHKGWTCIEWFDIGISDPEPKPEPEPIKRKPIKPSLRFEILKRDDYRCQMCGVNAKDGATLEIDHIHPVSKGGTNELDNLQVLCRDCNAGKGAQCQ